MEAWNLDDLQKLILDAEALLFEAFFSEPEEQGATVTYLPSASQLKYLGHIDSPEYDYTLSRCGLWGIREQEKRPFGRLVYHRILRRDGKVLRIDTCFLGKTQMTRLFRYIGNTRYCFTFLPGKLRCEDCVEAVVFDNGVITEEYRVENRKILYQRYFDRDERSVKCLCLDYFPVNNLPLRCHSEGVYTLGKSVRYRETFLWMHGDGQDPSVNHIWGHRIGNFFSKFICSIGLVILLFIPFLYTQLMFSSTQFWPLVRVIGQLLVPVLVGAFLFSNNRARTFRQAAIFFVAFILIFFMNVRWIVYDESITIDTTPNINVYEYLPFDEDSRIVKLDREASLELTGELPILDGAAAVFPVYSSFVNALYPRNTKIYDEAFQYNNTVGGYNALADKATDIFFGAYPSEEQIEYAKEQGTTFVYTPIGMDAFVFLVHKENPIDNLTSEQVRGIYSGQITNWAQVGGSNTPISPYQRNEGSGSQSMLIRFMGDTPILEPETELISGFMSGTIEQVVDYRNRKSSIGFSFRFYVEGIIQNPDVKLLSIDGVAPTVENIQNGTYPLSAFLYAVTWEGNDNPNVDTLLQWVLSEEGQWIIEKTGYVPIGG